MGIGGQRGCTCGRRYDYSQWDALPMIEQLAAEKVASFVTAWPAHLVVEVRGCACGRPMSRVSGAGGLRRVAA